MIVSIRGTSGSGKSYIVRRVLDAAASGELVYRPSQVRQTLFGEYGRPCGYRLRTAADREVYVVGNYEVQNGGCDTIKDGRDAIYAEVLELAQSGRDVLYEGLMVCEVGRTVALASKFDLLVVHIDHPLEACLAAVQQRRSDVGDLRPINPKKTTEKHRELESQRRRLVEAGVRVVSGSREVCQQAVFDALGLS